jgi:hypothetical protein
MGALAENPAGAYSAIEEKATLECAHKENGNQ